MELWIRSQDKELLVKVKEIELGEYDDYYCLVVNNLQNIGKYKTKERALEVLDEIQNVILCKKEEKYSGKGFVNELAQAYIYEMPEK